MATESYRELANKVRIKEQERKKKTDQQQDEIEEYRKQRIDGYGFEHGPSFDYKLYNEIQSDYLAFMATRAAKWQKLMKNERLQRNDQLKRYIRKGVPERYRSRVWLFASGADRMMAENKGRYLDILRTADNEEVITSIKKDILRTFPENIHFREDSTESKCEQLYNVLVAYGHYNQGVGYCQGLNYIAAMLLMATKQEEVTFWLLVALTTKILPDYYSKGMSGLIVDQAVFTKLLSQKMGILHIHLQNQNIDATLYATKWFICLFADVLPSETVFRLWDAFFYEGSKVLFRTALAIMMTLKNKLLSKNDFGSILQAFKSLSDSADFLDCNQFINNMFVMTNPLSKDTISKLREECSQSTS